MSTQTINQSSNEKVAHWNEVVCANYVKTDTRVLTQDSFGGSLEVRNFGPVTLSRIQSSPIEYERFKAEDDGHHFFITLTLCQEAYLLQDGRESRQGQGDIVIFDSAKPYLYQFPQGDNQVVLSVSRDTMLRHLPNAPILSSLTLKGSSPIGNLSRSMLLEAWSAGHLAEDVGERISKALLDIIATGFDTEFALLARQESSHHFKQLSRIKSYILKHLDSAELSIEQIAHDNFVSPRTLNRLFASEGTTTHRWLWEQRIAACRDALLRSGPKRISEIALSMGFKNLSHFSRSFRQAYGVSPQEMLNQSAKKTG